MRFGESLWNEQSIGSTIEWHWLHIWIDIMPYLSPILNVRCCVLPMSSRIKYKFSFCTFICHLSGFSNYSRRLLLFSTVTFSSSFTSTSSTSSCIGRLDDNVAVDSVRSIWWRWTTATNNWTFLPLCTEYRMSRTQTVNRTKIDA